MDILQDILKIVMSTRFAYSVLRLMTPILLATLAAMITQRSGITNMALEGTMLFASLFGVISSATTQSAFIGLLCAILTGLIISTILAYFALELQTDITLACIAMNLLASGGTIFILFLVSGDRGMSSSLQSKVLPQINIPLIKDIPIIGEILSGHNVLTYVAILMVVVVHIMMFKSPLGLRLRAVGENPDAAASVGISVKKTKYTALLICGVLAGMAGAYMSMGYMSMFTRDMISGRGYIALAASNVGGQAPIGGLLSSLLFGLFDAIANNMQQFKIPAEFIQTIPYVSTLILLGVSSYKRLKESGVKKKKVVA